MTDRKPTPIDGRVATDLPTSVALALRARGLRLDPGEPLPAADPDRYSEQTMTAPELAEFLAMQGRISLINQGGEEFHPDRLPPLHKFTAEWVERQLVDPHEAPWLVLFGPVGCGKTSQSFAAAKSLISARGRQGRRFDWRFVTHRNFAAKVQRGSDEDAEEVLERYATAKDLLIFSDLGDFNPQDFGRAVDYTSRLINERYRLRAPTIYETNLLYDRTPEIVELERELGEAVATLDQVLDGRVIDRLKAGWLAPLPERNYRRTQGRVMGA